MPTKKLPSFGSFNHTGVVSMKLFVLAMIFSAFQAAATDLPPDDQRLNQSLGAHIEFLADDLLEGRGTGTPGYDIAARYVASQFKQLGLLPGGESNTWFQSVPLLEGKRIEEGAHFELSSSEGSIAMEYNLDYLAGANFLETNVTIKGSLVFAGYGVHAPELDYDDFKGIDLKGKIAVILQKAPPRFPATSLAHHSSAREKNKHLVAHGAVAVISIPTPKDLEEAPWPKRVTQSRFSRMHWLRPDGTPVDVYPQIKAGLSISPRGSGKLFSRAPKSLAETLAAASRSEPQNFPLHLEATINTRSEHKRLTSPNVIGILPGTDPQLKNEAIVFTAHLDHQGRGPAINGDAIYNGAYDNAIGTAMMLEAARLLKNQTLRRSIIFAAVTAEEKGLIGSDYLAQNWHLNTYKPVANLNLDMVLVTTATKNFTILGAEHSTLRQAVDYAAKLYKLDLHADPEPERVVFVRSDQYSFVRQGVPAIFPKVYNLTNSHPLDGFISPEQFVQKHYHRPSDDLSLPRDAPSSVTFVRFMAEIARHIAQADEAPKWNEGDFFGETFGRAKKKL